MVGAGWTVRFFLEGRIGESKAVGVLWYKQGVQKELHDADQKR